MRSHYAVTSEIRYYGLGEKGFDFSRWKDAPHVALANLRDDPKAVLRFTRTYGALGQYENVLGPHKRKTDPVQEALHYRDFLRRAWEGDTFTFFALPASHGATLCAMQAGGFIIATSTLWPLIQVMFIQDWQQKRIKKCGNPDCPAPYFCAVRKGQKFCSQRCAVLINVRHFREREAARKAKGGKYAKAKKA
jgi:hypothetical protein